MHLSKRLQMVTDCVTKGNTVADVGCDHAYISIYLVEHEIATRTVALDINRGPLERAAKNVSEYGYCDRISTRLSNGLEKLEPGEVQTIVIAGMGGELMVSILRNKELCVDMAEELVLQPQSEIDKVRRYLHNRRFSITEENMCIDDGKYYVVIHAKNGFQEANPSVQYEKEPTLEQKVFDRYGQYLLENKHPVLRAYLEKELNKGILISEQLMVHINEKNQQRYEQIQEEIRMLKRGLAYY